MGFEGVDDQGDVLVEVGAQEVDPLADFVAVDLCGEGFVLQLFLHAGGFEGVDAAGTDEAAGHDEAGQFVAGEQGAVEEGFLGDPPVASVARDRVRDVILAVFEEPGDDAVWVVVGPGFVIGIVKQAGDGPFGFVGLPGAVAVGGGPHDGFDGPGVKAEGLALGPLFHFAFGLLV